MAQAAGFVHGRVCRRFDAFAGTPSMRRLPHHLDLHSMNYVAWRGV
jgi:hypothetical protein